LSRPPAPKSSRPGGHKLAHVQPGQDFIQPIAQRVIGEGRPGVAQSVFDCHFSPASRKQITEAVKRVKKDAKERYLKVNDRNLRVYISPARSPKGQLIGYFERFEMNLAK